MNKEKLKHLLESYRRGEIDEEVFIRTVSADIVIEDLIIKIDSLREIRRGYPETVFCLRKTPEQAAGAFLEIYRRHGRALATKATEEHYKAIRENVAEAEFFPSSGVIRAGGSEEKIGYVPVISAGSSDVPVCEEAYITLDFLGSSSEMVTDVGVAGIHRLEAVIPHLKRASCAIVVAGMEGALPGVIAGISPVPVIGVPTSVGYGVSFGGIAPLLTMLNSCAEGLTVVNIDNGFGAAVTAHMINSLVFGEKKR